MKRIFFFALTLLFSLGLHAQEGRTLPNDPAVRVGKLDNGMTYYIRHNELPEGRAEFYLATNVGAIQETPDQDGLAHFLEHMCFNGTKNFPGKKLLDYLQSIGASFGGNVNASTGVEKTRYMLNNIPLVDQSVIDTCLLITHDWSHFVTNDSTEIDKERGVIVEERRSRRNAAWRLHEKSLPYIYGDSKYGSCTLIGSQENLLNFKPESLRNFYKTWYRPDLQAIIVVGDVDVEYVEKKIHEIFADIPAPVNPKAKDVIMIPDNKEPVVGILTDPEYTQVNIQVMWKSKAAPKEMNNTLEAEAEDIVKSIISQVLAERFSDIAAEPDSPFLAASAYIGNLTNTCEVLMGQVNVKEGEALTGFRAFMTEMEKAGRYGFSEDEVTRAQNDILAAYETAAKTADTRKNSQFIGPLINNFFDNTPFMDPSVEYELVKNLMPMITAGMVNEALKAEITDENMVIIYEGPEKAGIVQPSEEEILTVLAQVRASDIKPNEEKTVAADFLDASKLKGSPVRKVSSGIYGSTVWTLKNGLEVILYPTEYNKDRVSFNLFKKGGSSLIATEDLPSFDDNIWGLFLENSGVASFSCNEVSKMLSGKNVSVSPYISSLRHGIEGTSTPKDLETAFQLAYLEFVEPRFDIDEYNQGIKTIEAILPNLQSQPNYKLQKRMYEDFFGNNPRRQMIDGSTLSKASLATIERVYRSLFNDVAGAKLVIVGDFLPSSVQPLVEKYFGSLPKGNKSTDWVNTRSAIVDANVHSDFSVDMQTPMTTVLDVFKRNMDFSYDREAAMDAVSYILNMRYTTSLREEEGGTYGASVSGNVVNAPEQYALIQIYYNSKPASADKLRSLAEEGIRNLATEGPTAEEFDMTVKNIRKNIPENRIKNSYWMSSIISHEMFGLDSDKGYEAAVNRLSPESVRQMASDLVGGYELELIMRPASSAEEE